MKELLRTNHFVLSKDDYNIYREGEIIEGVDLETFEIIFVSNVDSYFCVGLPYMKDKNNIYCGGENANILDIKAFTIIDTFCGYGYDKNNIYDINLRV